MRTLRDNKIAIILIYINLLFTFRVTEVCYRIRGVSYRFIFILFLVGTIIFMFYHSVLKRFKFKVLFTLLILISLVVVYFINDKFIQTMANNWLNETLVKMNSSIYESLPTYFYQYKPILVIAIPVLIVIFIALSLKGWGNGLIFFDSAMMINFWYIGYPETIKLYLFKCLFITIITYYCNGYINYKRLLNNRGIKAPDKSSGNIIYVILITFCISLLITLMPQEAKGKYDSNLFTKWTNAYSDNEKIKDVPGENLKYDISVSGYGSGDAKLGGPISIDDRLVLKVKSDKPYYLKGIVKNFYDGYSWGKNNLPYTKSKSKSEKVFNDALAIPYFQGNKSITVYPESIKTSTFFTPNYTYNVQAEKSSVFYSDAPTFLSNDFIIKPYIVNFYNIKTNIDVMSKNNIFQYSGENYSYNTEMNSERNLLYYKHDYYKYLQLPVNINEDIYKKVHGITYNCKSDFEKVEKIKEYLSKNYKYSLNVSEVPKDQEFLDYFLNVEKKGYCTYFATATTIFCRIAGIPARYVEGFNMTNEKDSEGLYMVTNENAHAWTEVLLLASKERGIWYTLDSVPNATEEMKKIKLAKQAATAIETDESGLLNSKKKINTKNNLIENDDNVANKKKISKAYIISIMGFSLIVLSIIIRHIMFAIKKSKIIKSKSIIPLYNYSLKRLEKVHIKKLNTDTDKEFLHKINDTYLKDTMNNIVELCYREFYGNKDIEGFDKVKYYEFIEKFIKSEQNIVKYYFVKYIFL